MSHETGQPRDPRRDACDELADRLSSDEGWRTLALLERTGMVVQRPAPAGDEASPLVVNDDEARPIGPWQPTPDADSAIRFVREPAGVYGDDWAPTLELAPKRSLLPFRVVVHGESAAAGFFFSPQFTPAIALGAALDHVAPGMFEVIDLTRIDMRIGEGNEDLLATVVRSLQLRPDILVLFSGNNWGGGTMPSSLPRGQFLHLAELFRHGGVPAINAEAMRQRRWFQRDLLDNIAVAAGSVGAPVITVVPEVNLEWEKSVPVTWLPGQSTARWHELLEIAEGHARRGAFAESLAAAEQMLELDGRATTLTHRLRANALLGLGDRHRAREAALDEVDVAACQMHAVPGASRSVREALHETVARHGFSCVDLPSLFSAASDGFPGRELFIDYCHLTVEGMRLAMAGVALEVLRRTGRELTVDARQLARETPEVPLDPAKQATARFLAGLYTLHWERRRNAVSPLATKLLDEALTAWPGMAGVMLEYLTLRSAPPHAALWSVAAQRLFAPDRTLSSGGHILGGEGRRLRRAALEPGDHDAIVAALERAGCTAELSAARALHQHGRLPPDGIELTHPFHLDRQWDSNLGVDDDEARCSGSVYRTYWRSSSFSFMAASSPIELVLVARLPDVAGERRGEARVQANGVDVGSVTLGPTWTRHRLRIPARPAAGLVRILVSWPPLGRDGDRAIAQILRRLGSAQAVDLHPVFAAVATFRARSAS